MIIVNEDIGMVVADAAIGAKAAIPMWRCCSPEHNERNGCSNPECFKYSGPAGWHQYGWGLFRYQTFLVWERYRATAIKVVA